MLMAFCLGLAICRPNAIVGEPKAVSQPQVAQSCFSGWVGFNSHKMRGG